MAKKLPIGIQSFEKIRTDNFYYVDKTLYIVKLVEEGSGWYFLSRPRRFGKSLFLDTLRQAFLGKKELFEGLYLENNWDWEKSYPVIHIDFAEGVVDSTETLKEMINSTLNYHSEIYSVELKERLLNLRLKELIRRISDKYQSKVVVLIDEYDKPILDRIENKEVALELREVLKNFYGVLKPLDAYIKFVFITGVSKFSKVSLFSGLNQLQDITLNPDYSTICGYTQKEFEEVFKDRLPGIDLEKVKCWYDGYSWLGESVYNPFDILLHLAEKDFRPYWFETGTPTFLIKIMAERRYYLPKLSKLKVGEQLIASFDVDAINPENLLFQTGYLTICDKISEEGYIKYTLKFPNREVQISFNNYFLTYLVEDYYKKEENQDQLRDAFKENDFQKIKDIFQSFFSSIPYEWYMKNQLSGYEGYYASVVYAYFCASGFEVIVEDATSVGKIDMTVFYANRVYVIEFKVVELEGEGKAISQLKANKYWEKYIGRGSHLYILGVEFSKLKRNIVSFDVAEMT